MESSPLSRTIGDIKDQWSTLRTTTQDLASTAKSWFTEYGPLVQVIDKCIRNEVYPIMRELAPDFAVLFELDRSIQSFYSADV